MTRLHVGIVGGGPVGLFLALMLDARGARVTLFERDAERPAGSRSIGVHPPSLELLDALDLAGAFCARGVAVRTGRAFRTRATQGDDCEPLGAVRFDRCPGAFRFVLAIPQRETEAILAEALDARASAARHVAHVRDVRDDGERVTVIAEDARGVRGEHAFDVLVGCDGKRSVVREALGIRFIGRAYDGLYAMADFPDRTAFGSDAAVFIGGEGLVESFPLPGRERRWVARLATDATRAVPQDEALSALVDAVARRTGILLAACDGRHPSVFRAERYAATAFARGRVALVGDAAHVVSPIGGQGMNLGWLGAASLADALLPTGGGRRGVAADRVGPPSALSSLLAWDAARRERMARAAARRAEINMWLGRPAPPSSVRDALLRLLLKPPVGEALARAFTMRGLALGV